MGAFNEDMEVLLGENHWLPLLEEARNQLNERRKERRKKRSQVKWCSGCGIAIAKAHEPVGSIKQGQAMAYI